MKSKIFSEKTARRLTLGGVIGFFTGIVLLVALSMPLYGKLGECSAEANACTDNVAEEQIWVRLVFILMYVSVVAILTGVLMIIALHYKGKKK